MLCTRCSAPITPIVALDIDGTLGDYHGHFYDFACAYTHQRLRPFYDGSCEWHEWWGMDLQFYREIKLAYRQGGGKRTMPPDPELPELLEALQAVPVEVWITTTRPYLRLDNVDPDTRFWLNHYGVVYDGMIYDEHKYEILSKTVDPGRVIAIVDDLPEQIGRARRFFGDMVPLHKHAPHNRTNQMRPGTSSLSAVAKTITARYERWEENNR